MSSVRCFMVEIVRRSRWVLRRYASESKCPGEKFGYHQAMSVLFAETPDDLSKDSMCNNPPAEPDHSDVYWPTKCDQCDYLFAPSDIWQVFGKPLYRNTEDGVVAPLEEFPAGAMWDAFWWPEKGPDGKYLAVKLPGGFEWFIDGPASNSEKPWSRSGTPPLLTVRPSILSPNYHGFLTNGFLESC